MSIPRNLCFSPLYIVRFPNISDIVSITFVFTSSSTCDTLLSSTHNAILHCLYLMVLFDMHLPYGLIRKPCYSRAFEYRSYHSSEDSMNPYKDFRRHRYITFTKFSTRTFSLCLGFTSHMMLKISPSIFNRMNSSSGVSALRYAPGTSKMPHLFLHVN